MTFTVEVRTVETGPLDVRVGTGAVVEFLCEGCAQVLCAVGIE